MSVWLMLLALQPVLAQTNDLAAVQANEIKRVIDTIEDEKKRTELIKSLRVLSDSTRVLVPSKLNSPGASILRRLALLVEDSSTELARSLVTLTSVPSALVSLGARLDNAEGRGRWFDALTKIVAVVLPAWLAAILVRRLLTGSRVALERSRREGFFERIPVQLGRTVLEFIATAAFAVAGYGMLTVINSTESTRFVAIAIINATALTRIVVMLVQMPLSPNISGLRLIPSSDETANYVLVWTKRVTLVSVFGYALVETTLLLGLSRELHSVLLSLLGLIVLLLLVTLVQQTRLDVAKFLSGDTRIPGVLGAFRKSVGSYWNVAAIIYLIVVYAVWVGAVPGGFSTLALNSGSSLLIIGVTSAVAVGLHRVIDRGFRLSDELRSRFPALEQRTNRYVPRLKAAASTVVWTLAAISILNTWGVDVLRVFENDLGREIGTHLGGVIVIVLGAYLVWEVLNIVIEHGLARPSATPGDRARIETLLPLARKVALTVICVFVAMTVLSELGVDIGPLLAGAGVVGLAVGFGAQTLVKDIITGAFILLEDSISVTDYVEVGGHEGTVESISMRTIRLRDIEGNVYTVPFSSVSSVKNYTRDYGISLLEIAVAYREDVDRVIDVLHELGAEMIADVELAKDIIEPLFVQGVQRLDDSGVIIRARIKTIPGMQWSMRREFYRRMKKRFDERDIEIPFPHRTVYFGVNRDGQAGPARIALETKA